MAVFCSCARERCSRSRSMAANSKSLENRCRWQNRSASLPSRRTARSRTEPLAVAGICSSPGPTGRARFWYVGKPARFQFLTLSPDATRAAVYMNDQGNTDIWLIDLETGARTRFTFDPAQENNPAWSPDGALRGVYPGRRA